MKNTGTSLPFEVFQIIDSYLYNDERAACISVCWDWYIIFKQLLYKHIVISYQRQFQDFYEKIHQGYNIIDDIGTHVKSIQFLPSPTFTATQEICQEFHKALLTLPQVCPNIYSLDIPRSVILWHDENVTDQRKEDSNGVLLPFAPCLTQLTLAFNQTPPNLSLLSHLQHINFVWAEGVLGINRLRHIHQSCPLLQSLSLSVHDIEPSFEQDLQHAIKTDDTIISAQHLTEFSIESQKFIDRAEPWFLYASCKYPNLEYFGLKSVSPTTTSTEDESEDNQDIGLVLLNRYQTYSSFVKHCQKLHTLVLGNILPDHILLESISTIGIQLRRLDVETVFGLPRSTFELLIQTVKSSITSISINSLLRIRNTANVLMNSLNTCRQLTHLTLGKQPSIPVDLVLDQCPQLKSLSLYDTMATLNALDNGDAWVYSKPHVNLHRFSLDKILFDNSLFDYLTRRCSHLTHLTLTNSICSSVQSNNGTFAVRIHMPTSRLGQVKISKLFLGRYPRKVEEQIKSVALSIIEEKSVELQCERPDFDVNITRWYQAGRFEESMHKSGYLAICCQSIDRLFINDQRLI